MTPADRSPSAPQAVREDSDIIAALIRTAIIIAFYSLRYYYSAYPVPLYMDLTLWAAAIYNLGLLALHLADRPLRRQRPLGLLLDLLLVTAAIVTVHREGYDLFNLYYLVVIAAAVWFRLIGAISVSIVAIVLALFAPHVLLQYPLAVDEVILKAPLLMLVAVIAGYLMRAHDAEHVAIVALRQEMRLARTLQSRLLPSSLPRIEAYDLGLIFEPARQVGGDFYDLRLLDDDHLFVVLADMSGKSVYGLVHLSLVFSHLQAAANEGFGPAEIARIVNRGTYAALQPESYASVFIATLRLSDGLLTYVNCGHVPPLLLYRDEREPALLATGGTVIGAIPEPMYEERQARLEAGDILVCYSDGISEARSTGRQFYGEEKVAQMARQGTDLPAQDLAAQLYHDATHFAASPGQDDVTVVVIHKTPPAPPGGAEL
ncbi:MAG: PP2C family protein-serine/threonine phosphatase [Armatimonadia bacterium]